MTSEIALLNQSAVVLAADSATTVTYWDEGQKKELFFKGANKIFHLSAEYPVGIMTNGSADLQGLPWEVLVKAYRDDRGGKRLERLSEYAVDLFDFLVSNEDIFPADYQKIKLIRSIVGTARNIAFSIYFSREFENANENADQQKEVATQLFETRRAEVAADVDICAGAEAIIRDIRRLYLGEVRSALTQDHSAFEDYFVIDELVTLGILGLFKKKWTSLQSTGLVIAGFGFRDYFPALEQHECYGVLAGRVIAQKVQRGDRAISHDSPSEIVPLAQCEMADTFMFGASNDALNAMDRALSTSLRGLIDALIREEALAADYDIGMVAMQAQETFRHAIRDHLWKNHTTPLRRAIGMLPVGELAELAEILVYMESKKERVTRPTESVGGAIDVAVITKGDGFIWIKRKHYFDPGLNPRYVKRLQVRSGEHDGKESSRPRKGKRAAADTGTRQRAITRPLAEGASTQGPQGPDS